MKGLTKTYHVRNRFWSTPKAFHAVDHIDLSFARGEVYGIVGESGSGKTTLGRLLAGLLTPSDGTLFFEGLAMKDWMRKRKEYAKKVQIIFQNPFGSLNDKWRVDSILKEGIQDENRKEQEEKVRRVIAEVGIPSAYLSKKAASFKRWRETEDCDCPRALDEP